MTGINQIDPPIHFAIRGDGLDILRQEVPMRLRVGTIEFLGPDDDPYLPLWVVDVVPRGVACLRVAHRYGRAALDLYGYGQAVLFVRDGADMIVCNPAEPIATRARYATLLTAWTAFAHTIRDIALVQHPEEATNPWWALISNEPPSNFAEELMQPSFFGGLDQCLP